MKYIVFSVCLAVCLAVGASATRCSGESDCEEDECCVARGLFFFVKGDCKKLANEDEDCSHPDDRMPFHKDKYAMHCPCAAGLSCEPTEVKELPFIGTIKIDERCVTGVTTSAPEITEEPEVTVPEE